MVFGICSLTIVKFKRKSNDSKRKDKMQCVLGGYSLAGFFALWSSYQTELFDGIAAVSPSVWYPQWMEYAKDNKPLATSVYLSLGDKEEKTKNPTMAEGFAWLINQN